MNITIQETRFISLCKFVRSFIESIRLVFFRWLAHDAVEEDLTAKYGLLPWALQTTDDQPSMDLKNDFKRFLSKKNDLWTRMGFRARVSKDQCDEVSPTEVMQDKRVFSFFADNTRST